MRVIFILLTLLPIISFSQVTDSFNDGDFLNNPKWSGDINSFIINADQELQLFNDQAGISYLSTPSTSIEEGIWKVHVKMAFNPSSSNLSRIYLAGDSQSLENSINAVYVEIGSTDDNISLYKIENGITQKMIEGSEDRINQSEVDVVVKVTRDANSWQLSSKTGDEWTVEGTADFEFNYPSHFFGIFCKYTKTRADKFFFDDIDVVGQAWSDKTPPRITEFLVINGSKMQLRFDEELDESSISVNNFGLKSTQRQPSSYEYNPSDHLIHLNFNPLLDDAIDEEIHISNLQDKSGNQIIDTSFTFSYQRIKVKKIKLINHNTLFVSFTKPIPENSFNSAVLLINNKATSIQSVDTEDQLTFHLIFNENLAEGNEHIIEIRGLVDSIGDEVALIKEQLLYYIPERFDIVFNEWMADPNPSMGLPEIEYIELKNNSDFDISLNNYQLSVNDKTVLLPDSIIPADDYACLVSYKNKEEWVDNGKTIYISDLPTLNNSGFDMILFTNEQDVIDAFSYDPQHIIGEGFKTEGGWSVERVDPLNFSSEYSNFNWCMNLEGGTPGGLNSVYEANPDLKSPIITNINLVNNQSLQVHFSETMRFDGNINLKLEPNLSINELSYDTLFLNHLNIHFDEKLAVNELIELTEIQITDIAGNPISWQTPLFFGMADTLEANDIVINEVLFNPYPGGEDFVELYNKTDKIINLSDIYLAKYSDQGIDKLYKTTNDNAIIAPHSYLALTSAKTSLMEYYNCQYPHLILECSSLPSYPDDEGHVAITNHTGSIIDEFKYQENMHFDLLKNKEGVSLERLSWKLATSDHQNWSSAASTAGYATPGYINSQQLNDPAESDLNVYVDPEVFTPNGDGTDDRTNIYFSTQTPGTTASIRIFDVNGHEVRQLANNQTMSNTGFVSWDGLNDEHSRLRPGIYVVYIQTIQPNGEVNENKLTCVIGTANIK